MARILGRALTVVVAVLVLVVSATLAPAKPPPKPPVTPPGDPTPIQVFGAWHCSDDYCTWGTERDMDEFHQQNGWLVEGNGGKPAVNLVVLAFVNPLDLLHGTSAENPRGGVPIGMTPEVVDYFTGHGVRVMVSIGGITYTDDWNTALAEDAAGLGEAAATMAEALGVGVEIDYEQNTSPDLDGLQVFIDAYRSVHSYDPTGANPAARLTIDLAAGDRWLIALTRKATADWLSTADPVLDYANAMVPARQPRSAADAIANWQEHLDGKPQYAPPIPPLAPAKFTGSLYVALGRKPLPECVDYAASLQRATAPFVQTAASRIDGTTNGMLGFMFWAAERPAVRGIGTVPPNTCEGGMGVAAAELDIPVPMPALRQE